MSTSDVFFEGAIFHLKKLVRPGGGWDGGRVRVGVGGDTEIWTQFSICLGADYFL